jgi:septum site-determining protein MinD
LIDCPAGIEQGFKNAIAGADRAVIVTTPEVSAVRDADRIIGLLEAEGKSNPKLIVNRIRPQMVKKGDMMDIDDIIEILAIDLLGIIPEDEYIVISTNRGEPAVVNPASAASTAYKNIVRRMTGENVPLMTMEANNGFFSRLKKIFGF